MSNPAYFDPDDITLTRADVNRMIDAVIVRWQRQPTKHRIQITALKAFRLSLRMQSDDAINEVVKSIITFTNQMQEANAILRMKGEMPKTSQLVDLIYRRITSEA